MKSIEVTVDPEGQVRIEAVGFVGGSCALATKALEEAMGHAGKKTKKPAFYQVENGKQSIGGGR